MWIYQPTSLYKSKRDRVTEEWCVSIDGIDAVTRFIDRIGFLPGSNVETRYKLIWSLYQKYKESFKPRGCGSVTKGIGNDLMLLLSLLHSMFL
jgi:hypothetical protein